MIRDNKSIFIVLVVVLITAIGLYGFSGSETVDRIPSQYNHPVQELNQDYEFSPFKMSLNEVNLKPLISFLVAEQYYLDTGVGVQEFMIFHKDRSKGHYAIYPGRTFLIDTGEGYEVIMQSGSSGTIFNDLTGVYSMRHQFIEIFKEAKSRTDGEFAGEGDMEDMEKIDNITQYEYYEDIKL